MKYRHQFKSKLSLLLFLFAMAAFFVFAHFMGLTAFRSGSRIGYFESKTSTNWSASYLHLNGVMKKYMNTTGAACIFHIESETKSGTLSIEIEDSDGTVIFSEPDMKNQSFDVKTNGKIKVIIKADNCKGNFSITKKLA